MCQFFCQNILLANILLMIFLDPLLKEICRNSTIPIFESPVPFYGLIERDYADGKEKQHFLKTDVVHKNLGQSQLTAPG